DREAAGRVTDEQRADQQQESGAGGQHQGEEGGAASLGVLPVEGDEQERDHRRELEGEEHGDEIGGEGQGQDAEEKDENEGAEAAQLGGGSIAFAEVMGQVGRGVDEDR